MRLSCFFFFEAKKGDSLRHPENQNMPFNLILAPVETFEFDFSIIHHYGEGEGKLSSELLGIC